MRALEFIQGHVIYNPAYTYKFQLKTNYIKWFFCSKLKNGHRKTITKSQVVTK